MKIVKILGWVLRIILLGLLIILIIDNLQTTTFNVFGIYSMTLPLIIITLIFLIIGIAIGLIISLFKTFELKAKINILEKELKTTNIINTNAGN